jgi:hypothetical protein
MADLAAVLTDPNFVNANPATKQAIFDKWAPQDPNFANANPATQQAIMQKFGLGAPALPTSLQPSMRAETGMPGERQPAPELTTGQKIYQAVRPYAAPIVETGGAIAGGLLGGTAGTFGAGPVGTVTGGVAGAGLGYGIGKELVEVADVAMGMKAPRQGAAQVVEPVRNVLEGAVMETGGRIVAPLVVKGVGAIADLRRIPQQKAAAIAQKALGDDLPKVVNALRNAPDNVSVAELTAKIDNPAWQALIKDALEKDPQFVRKARLLGERESRNVLNALVGGTTAAEVRAVNELAKTNLTTITTPMREAALKRGNLGKYVADEANIRAANDLATLIGSGAKIDPAQFVAQATGAEKALRSVGVKPLESAALIQRISATADDPAFAGNDLISGAVKNVADDITKWTGPGGVIDLTALEAIRKNSVNAAIAQLRPGADATSQRNLAASVLSKIKPAIDDAIEAAGGAGWRDYLNTHAKGMRNIAEKKLTGEAARLWKADKDAFVRLVQNESPDVVEKFLGPGNYNIATELADSTMSVLQKQAEKRLTELAIKEQVSEGGAALSQLLKQETSRLRFPSFLNFWASAGNKTLSELEQRLGAKTMAQLTQAMKTPQGAANLLETLPAAERSQVLQLISDPAEWAGKTAKDTLVGGAKRAQQAAEAIRTGTATGSVNALAPDRYNDNALNNQPVRRIELNNMAPGRP